MICECLYEEPKHWWQKGKWDDGYCYMHNLENKKLLIRKALGETK